MLFDPGIVKLADNGDGVDSDVGPHGIDCVTAVFELEHVNIEAVSVGDVRLVSEYIARGHL
jgi:hypothetical protein